MQTIIRNLEQKTQSFGERKILYSRTSQTAAIGMWPDIKEKVLSE